MEGSKAIAVRRDGGGALKLRSRCITQLQYNNGQHARSDTQINVMYLGIVSELMRQTCVLGEFHSQPYLNTNHIQHSVLP